MDSMIITCTIRIAITKYNKPVYKKDKKKYTDFKCKGFQQE